MAWPYRELADSDSSTDDYYTVDQDVDPETGAPRIYKRNNHMALWPRVYVLNYLCWLPLSSGRI